MTRSTVRPVVVVPFGQQPAPQVLDQARQHKVILVQSANEPDFALIGQAFARFVDAFHVSTIRRSPESSETNLVAT